jgi:hypothetical protein
MSELINKNPGIESWTARHPSGRKRYAMETAAEYSHLLTVFLLLSYAEI